MSDSSTVINLNSIGFNTPEIGFNNTSNNTFYSITNLKKDSQIFGNDDLGFRFEPKLNETFSRGNIWINDSESEINIFFEPVSKDFLYNENSEKWKIIDAADYGDVLNHVEAKQIFSDNWVKRHGFSDKAVKEVREDLLELSEKGEIFLLERLKERRKHFRPEARQLWLTKFLTSGIMSSNDNFNNGVRDTTRSRILGELQFELSNPLNRTDVDFQSEQKVGGRLVRVIRMEPLKVESAPEFNKVKLEPLVGLNPLMVNSNAWMHSDNLASDTSPHIGPVLENVEIRRLDNEGIMPAMNPAFAFDNEGNIITMRFQGNRTDLMKINPETLNVETSIEVPGRKTTKTIVKNLLKTGDIAKTVQSVFSDTSGGAYFFLDNKNRVIIPAADHSLMIINQVDGKYKLERKIELDEMKGGITGVMQAWPQENEKDSYAWVASNKGSVGLVNFDTGKVKTLTLPNGEEIENSFPAGKNGAFVVSNKAMYRFDREGDSLKQVWRSTYPTEGQSARQFNSGSGTTPTLMGNDYVVIVDGLKPTKVHVFSQENGRKVAETTVFSDSKSAAVENSVIAHGNKIVVVNSTGYTNVLQFPEKPPTGGMEVLELNNGKLEKVWKEDHKVLTATPQLSANGLVYVYSGEFNDNKKWDWSVLGINLENGKEEYRLSLAENTTNPAYDNAWATFSIGPDGIVGGNWNGLYQIRDIS